MRAEKNKAIQLRKKGKSYSQIKEILNVSKSTLSTWLKDIELSEDAKKILDARAYNKSVKALIKRNKLQTNLAKEKAEFIRDESKKEINLLLKDPLFIIGISLYWAEGYKKGADGSKWKSVDFANSDPEMIAVMMNFFHLKCKIPMEAFRAQVIAHENVDIEKAISYWSRLTKIPRARFCKTSLPTKKPKKGKKRENTQLTHGTLHIRINDVSFFFEMIGWIDGLKEKFGTIAQR